MEDQGADPFHPGWSFTPGPPSHPPPHSAPHPHPFSRSGPHGDGMNRRNPPPMKGMPHNLMNPSSSGGPHFNPHPFGNFSHSDFRGNRGAGDGGGPNKWNRGPGGGGPPTLFRGPRDQSNHPGNLVKPIVPPPVTQVLPSTSAARNNNNGSNR